MYLSLLVCKIKTLQVDSSRCWKNEMQQYLDYNAFWKPIFLIIISYFSKTYFSEKLQRCLSKHVCKVRIILLPPSVAFQGTLSKMSGPIPYPRLLDSSCTYHIDLFSALGNVPVTRYGIRNFSKIQWLKTTTILSFFTCESGIPIELCWMMLLFFLVFSNGLGRFKKKKKKVLSCGRGTEE